MPNVIVIAGNRPCINSGDQSDIINVGDIVNNNFAIAGQSHQIFIIFAHPRVPVTLANGFKISAAVFADFARISGV